MVDASFSHSIAAYGCLDRKTVIGSRALAFFLLYIVHLRPAVVQLVSARLYPTLLLQYRYFSAL
jgi:hypothetical protein